ncbi:MAG: hypothetical protein ACK2UC_04390 [Anaerolineae bacterium]|jgi:uncharacterized cupin superfamily protein
MQPKVTDVEVLKKQVRRLAAGRVLSGDSASVGLDLARADGFQACIKAGYGELSSAPEKMARDRLLWILDGYAEIHDDTGRMTAVSQGESTVLKKGAAYRLHFPNLTLYLSVEAEGRG